VTRRKESTETKFLTAGYKLIAPPPQKKRTTKIEEFGIFSLKKI
jgi:hypothetical protein